jgi:ADP-heptose:LPS heptosyltransferase
VSGKALLYCAGGGLGDSLVASVVARALHEKYETVHALTLPGHLETLERVPDLDGVLADAGQSEAELCETLKAQAYDAAIVTWATQRTARVPQLAGIPVRVGQTRRLYSWRFTHRVPVRSERGDVTTHWSQILLDYARAIGCDVSDAAPSFVTTQGDERAADALLHELGITARFVVMHPANAIATRRGRWPLGGWIRLGRALGQEFDVPVLVSGSHAEASLAETIADGGGAESIAGRLPIGGFAALARRAQLFVGITTGTMHVAAAVGAPTVGVFPFQSDTPDRWAPLGPHTSIVRATYPCRRGERKETCPDYACVEHLDVDRILAAARSLLTAAP